MQQKIDRKEGALDSLPSGSVHFIGKINCNMKRKI